MDSILVVLTIPRGSVLLGRVIDYAVGLCVERWAGCTLSEAIGYWRNPTTGLLDAEPVAVLTVDCPAEGTDNAYSNVQGWFDRLADRIRIDAKQHTVYWRASATGASRFVSAETVLLPEPQTQLTPPEPQVFRDRRVGD